MADKEELDLDVQQGGGGKKHLILYIVIGVLILALGGVMAMFLLKGDDKAEADKEPAEVEVVVKVAHYLPIDRLIVNFGQGSPVRYLQVDLQLMSYDPEALKALTMHMPVVRNDILLLLGSQRYESVSTIEGKEALRTAVQEKVQQILDVHEKDRKIESVYFTEFVMQ